MNLGPSGASGVAAEDREAQTHRVHGAPHQGSPYPGTK